MKKLILLITLATLFSCKKDNEKTKCVVFFKDGTKDTLSVYSMYQITLDSRLVHYRTNLSESTTIAKDVKYIKEL